MIGGEKVNSIISWVGGKKALRNLIYERMPKSYGRYIEVFGGGGWVLFGKRVDKRVMEVYNDFNSNLANMFYCVKHSPCEFIRHLGFLPLNSRDEFNEIKDFINKKEFTKEHLQDELELAERYLSDLEYAELKPLLIENAERTDVRRAVNYFKLIRYSYGSGTTSFGCNPFDIRKTFYLIWEASRRLSNTVIENKDFEALIRQYDRVDAFFYCDPPYFETEGHYEVKFAKEDHERLKKTLASSLGKWMVSYNDCEFIRELYAEYNIEAVTRVNSLALRYDSTAEFPEVLISNYDMTARSSMPEQITLLPAEERYEF